MQVLLINPPFKNELGKFSREQRSPAITKSGTFYYPMWLAYTTGWLEKNDVDCFLIDATTPKYSYEQIIDMVKKDQPKMIVVDTSTPSIYNDVRFGVDMKKLAPDTFVVLVGPHVSSMPKESLEINKAIDAVAVYEYEDTLLDLYNEINKESPNLSQVKGIAYRKENDIIINPLRPLETNLDKYPFVSEIYKKYLDYKDYFYSHSRYPIITLITGRGCPYQCYYCVYPQTFGGHKLRYRSVENVLDEIEYVLKEFPDVQEIMFEDDTLTVDQKRAQIFGKEIIKKKLKFVWSANSRADISYDTMKILHKAGARLFCVGIESGEQAILDSMKKNLKIDTIRNFFKAAKKSRIRIHGCFIMGNRGETKSTLETTLRFAKELNPDTAQFFPLMVYPGTEAYDWAKENNYLTETDFNKWLTPSGLHNTMISTENLSGADLVAFCDRARKEFYMRPQYIIAKIFEGLTSPKEFKRLFKGFKHLIKYIFKGTF